MSPTKMGMDLFSKGRKKLTRIFGQKPSNPNEQSYQINYEPPRNGLFGQIEKDMAKINKKGDEKKRYQSFLQRTQDPTVHHEEHPPQLIYHLQKQEEEKKEGESAGSRAVNVIKDVERSSFPSYFEQKQGERDEEAKESVKKEKKL